MAVSLDTNCILALLLDDRPVDQKRVTRILEKHECHVADMVFTELEFVLRKLYGMSRGLVADNIRVIINLDQINANQSLIRRVLPIYESHSSLSFTDICLATYAELNNASPLYTSDKKLAVQMPKNAKLLV